MPCRIATHLRKSFDVENNKTVSSLGPAYYATFTGIDHMARLCSNQGRNNRWKGQVVTVVIEAETNNNIAFSPTYLIRSDWADDVFRRDSPSYQLLLE